MRARIRLQPPPLQLMQQVSKAAWTAAQSVRFLFSQKRCCSQHISAVQKQQSLLLQTSLQHLLRSQLLSLSLKHLPKGPPVPAVAPDSDQASSPAALWLSSALKERRGLQSKLTYWPAAKFGVIGHADGADSIMYNTPHGDIRPFPCRCHSSAVE